MTARRSTKFWSRPATPRSSRPAGSIRRVPRALERVCLKAMAADPQSRFPSADALRQALRRYRLTRQAAPVLGRRRCCSPCSCRPGHSGRGRLRRLPTAQIVRSLTRRETTEPQSEPKQSPRSGLRVTRFEIPHFPKLDEKNFDPKAAGPAGTEIVHGPTSTTT